MSVVTRIDVNEEDDCIVVHHSLGLTIATYSVWACSGTGSKDQNVVDAWIDDDCSIYMVHDKEYAYECDRGEWRTIYQA